MKTKDLKIVLVLMMMLLTGCVTGNARINVTDNYLDKLIEEQQTIQICCPATQEIVKDWIMQNAPE